MTVKEQLDEIRRIDDVLAQLKREKPQCGTEEYFLWETLFSSYLSVQNMLILMEGKHHA